VGANLNGLILPPGASVYFEVDGNAAGADHVSVVEYSFQRLDGLP